MPHTAHFELSRIGDVFLSYRLEGTGHVVLFPREWFPERPPKDITIEITDRQLSFIETETL